MIKGQTVVCSYFCGQGDSMELITSLKNPRVQAWKSLKDRKGRRETGCFLVEGRKSVEEALTSGFVMEALLVQDTLVDGYPVPEGVSCYALPEHVLAAVCDTKTPQGVAAVMRMQSAKIPGCRVVALDGVQDPGNVGTIIRTADAAGLDGVILTDQCADVFSPKVLRATMGSVFHLPITVTEDLPALLKDMQQEGACVISSQLEDASPFYAHGGVGERFVLVIGNEGNGVSAPVKALADKRLMLPMRGQAESLNAAVAAGIMMYELTRTD